MWPPFQTCCLNVSFSLLPKSGAVSITSQALLVHVKNDLALTAAGGQGGDSVKL